MEMTAEKNTWSNSRKKRRQNRIKNTEIISNDANISEAPTSVIAKTEENSEIVAAKSNDCMEIDAEEVSECNLLTTVSNTKEIITNKNDTQISKGNQDDLNEVEKNDKKRKTTEGYDERSSVSNAKKPKLEKSSPQSSSNLKKDAFLCCSLVVKDNNSKGSLVEVSWLGGGGGREAAHQVLHYFKNNLKTH